MPDAVVSIWTPQFTTMYARNISASITRGSYTFDAGGCGAASLDTNLTWEQIYTSGFFEGRNGVEISMQDDVVAASVAHGATKIYVTATAPYDPAIILEKMVIALWDGALLTVGIPVTGVGTDGGGPYITVGPPLSRGIAPGNPSDTLLPAYGAGTVIYRRRWAGRIARRTRYHDNTARKTTLALIGIGTRLKECQTNFTCNSVDAGAALAALVFNCRDRLVDLDIADLVMPTVGSTYSGQSTNAFVSDVITQILAAMTGGIWGVRVHSDRIPRLIKLYDQATNTYPHVINLSNHATHFVPAALQSDDEDVGSMWNAVVVSGNVGGSSSLTVTAANADLTSVATYGQIDGAPQTLTSIKDQATAALVATGLLNEHSYPQSSTSFELHVRNDWDLGLAALASPSGLANADVGSGFEAIYLAGFDETQSVKNRAVDSPLAFTSGPLALWAMSGGCTALAGAAPNGDNAFQLRINAVSYTIGPAFPCAPGERIRFGAVVDTTSIGTGPDPRVRWSILGNGNAVLGSIFAVPTVAGVQYLVSPDVIVPPNTYSLRMQCALDLPDGTRLSSAVAKCSMPYLIAGNQLALVGAAGNDVVNPTAAVDLLNWRAQQSPTGTSTFSHDNNPAAYGGGAGRFYIGCRFPAGATPHDAYLDQPVALEPGQTYTLTYAQEVVAPSADAGVLVDVFDYLTGAYLATGPAVSVAEGATGYTLRFTATSNVAWVRLRAYGTSVDAYFYQVSIARGTSPVAWNAGRTAANGFAPAYMANHAAPNIYGLPTSVTCAFEAAGDRTQSFSFAPVEPDINAIIAERAHAVANALLANTLPPVGVEAFVVSPEAGDYAYGPSGLTVAFPAFLAIFAKGTTVQTIASATVTLAASGTTHVWLQSSGVYAQRFNDPSNVPGAILIAYFTTSAVGVIGDFRRCSYGPLSAGAGTVNPAVNLPAPIIGSGGSVTNGFSLNGLAADINVVLPLTNVPSGNAATMVEFYYRIYTSGSPNAWIASEGENLGYAADNKTIVNPSQTVSFSYGSMVKGAVYDFGIAYRGPDGYGSIRLFTTQFTAQLIAIGTTYLLGGVAVIPTANAGYTVTNVASANGITAAVNISCVLNNQPTDGSLSRVNFWYRQSTYNNDSTPGSRTPGNPAFYWTPAGGLPAAGVASTPPPASGTYVFVIADITGSQTFDFGVTYENAQGGEGDVGIFVESFATQVIVISGAYLSEGTLVVPTVTGPTGTGLPQISVSIPGQYASQLGIFFAITNQPTDGSLQKIILYYRKSGQAAWTFFASRPPANSAGAILTGGATSAVGDYAFLYPDATNGTTYEFGVTVESNRGSESPTVSLGSVAKSMSVPPANSANFVLGGTTFADLGGAPAGTLNLRVTQPWTINLTAPNTDYSWIDHFDMYGGYYDSANAFPGVVQHTEPGSARGASGTFTFNLTVTANSLGAGDGNIYRYYYFWRVVAIDGTHLTSTTTIFAHT